MRGLMGKGESVMKRTLKHDDVVFMFSSSDPVAYVRESDGRRVYEWQDIRDMFEGNRIRILSQPYSQHGRSYNLSGDAAG